MSNGGELFSQQDFFNAAQSRKSALIKEIQNLDLATVLTAQIDELARKFEAKYSMNPPRLKIDEKYLPDPPREISQNEEEMGWDDKHVNVIRKYIQFTVCVPFEGDGNLFSICPTLFERSISRQMDASVYGNEIHLSYKESANGIQKDLNALYEADVKRIATNLQNLTADVKGYNSELPALIQQQLFERKQIAEKNQSLIQAFKIPIMRRDDIPKTYVIPEIQRKPSIIEDTKVKTFSPEPALEIREYEFILTIIKDMALAMERSPKTFIKLSEEEIRDFFIILLNGHYKGSATGETFNGNGKTDILIRYKNANAFISECKFWDGHKKMVETIDQLLSYVTWRDTKTSIILFNKSPDLLSVITKADDAIKHHKNFKSMFRFSSTALENSGTHLRRDTVIPQWFQASKATAASDGHAVHC
jgi:hypothetical protein